jgi:metallo-beta-lactamase family protein
MLAPMEIEFVGAAQCVTGSKHIVRTKHATVLLDCGLVQGKRRESVRENQSLGVNVRKLDAVVLSHAHIDHSGALPLLVKNGFAGAITMTPPTRDLCRAMLDDAATIQASDAEYINKCIERDGLDMDPVTPLYDKNDVRRVLDQSVAVPYGEVHDIAKGIRVTFYDAGHVLGSAVVVLDCEEDGVTKRIAFTGDLGRNRMPILRDPQVASGVDLLITESTYGDRLHKPYSQMEEELEKTLKETFARGGKVVIPSFSLERAQEVLFTLHKLHRKGVLPPMPVIIDSPLTIKITDVFRKHSDSFDEEASALVQSGDSPFDLPQLRYVSSKEDSQGISASDDPAIIISASGMCEAGRIVHHLRSTIESDKNTLLFVGYQAQHTLGRRILEGRQRVKIFGVERDVRAHVKVMNGFSAHADQADLIDYAKRTSNAGNVRDVVLVHGEEQAMNTLQGKLVSQGFGRVHTPAKGAKIVV